MRNSHLALVVGIALLLAGCGGGGGGGGLVSTDGGDALENLDGDSGGNTVGTPGGKTGGNTGDNLVSTTNDPPAGDLDGDTGADTGDDLGTGGDDTASGDDELGTGDNGDTEPGAGGEDDTSDSSVTPELLADWQTGDAALECGQAGGYDSWYKLDTGEVDGSWELGGISVDLAVDPEDGSLSWWATGAIGAVIVKGGTGAHAYVYHGGADADSGLIPPTNPSSGLPYGISHVTFCWSPEEEVAE